MASVADFHFLDSVLDRFHDVASLPARARRGSNGHSLLGMDRVPCDNDIRHPLDGPDAPLLNDIYPWYFEAVLAPEEVQRRI